MGSDESHFNVSVGSDGQSHKTVSTNHNLFEEKGEPKRYRTEVLPLTSLGALPLGQTGSHVCTWVMKDKAVRESVVLLVGLHVGLSKDETVAF